MGLLNVRQVINVELYPLLVLKVPLEGVLDKGQEYLGVQHNVEESQAGVDVIFQGLEIVEAHRAGLAPALNDSVRSGLDFYACVSVQVIQELVSDKIDTHFLEPSVEKVVVNRPLYRLVIAQLSEGVHGNLAVVPTQPLDV